ncbi:hypothetical protein HJFPF1_04998 [Paramyrothecium foliicola]|nr:hypothetical protein HJFPF1_04998 [Paramyrothecium foliicola]
MAVPLALCRPRLFSPAPASVCHRSLSRRHMHQQPDARNSAARQGHPKREGNKQGGQKPGLSAQLQKRPQPLRLKAVIPEEVRVFIRPDGTFQTTSENARFLQKYDIDWDIGKTTKFPVTGELRSLTKSSLQLAWSPRHIIHPYQLLNLSPRGQPLAPLFRDRYREKTLKQPLWLYVTSMNGNSAVVRTTARSRVKKAILTALEGLGYTAEGVGANREIRGTLWITDTNSIRSVNLPLAKVGKLIAEELVKKCSQPTTR